MKVASCIWMLASVHLECLIDSCAIIFRSNPLNVHHFWSVCFHLYATFNQRCFRDDSLKSKVHFNSLFDLCQNFFQVSSFTRKFASSMFATKNRVWSDHVIVLFSLNHHARLHVEALWNFALKKFLGEKRGKCCGRAKRHEVFFGKKVLQHLRKWKFSTFCHRMCTSPQRAFKA